MASRHLSRSLVLQTLFECDMQNTLSPAEARIVLGRDARDPSHKDADHYFAELLLQGVFEKMPEIDAVIVKAAPQWPLDKIAPIDRNVLRIGLFELLFADRAAVPPKVALNEAIELAKSYGGETSGKFINGVLGAVYREIGEPGKDASPKAHGSSERLGGAVAAVVRDGIVSVALVHDAFGKWTLPKARCKEGETTEETAERAIMDELGVSGRAAYPLGTHAYVAHEPDGTIEKSVEYHLVCLKAMEELQCKECEGITDTKWFSESDLLHLPMYKDLMKILQSGIEKARDVCR